VVNLATVMGLAAVVNLATVVNLAAVMGLVAVGLAAVMYSAVVMYSVLVDSVQLGLRKSFLEVRRPIIVVFVALEEALCNRMVNQHIEECIDYYLEQSPNRRNLLVSYTLPLLQCDRHDFQ
jgi:Zn-dependent alcohol dehydrogenase